MIEAELHGKTHTAEDRHTSTCLGLLRLLPDSYLLEFLGKAETREGRLLPKSPFDLIEEIRFWPYLRGAGEPDAIVGLRNSNSSSSSFTLIVEAKHGAPKSSFEPSAEEAGTAEAHVGTDNEMQTPQPRDQLARYLRAGRHEYQRVGLIYLTHHRSMPCQDIDESLKAVGEDGPIYWLSWFELYTFAVDRLENSSSLEFSAQKILEALRRYLEFQGYVRFRRWCPLTTPKSEPPTLYQRVYGFGVPTVVPAASYARRYPLAVTVAKGSLRPLYLRSK